MNVEFKGGVRIYILGVTDFSCLYNTGGDRLKSWKCIEPKKEREDSEKEEGRMKEGNKKEMIESKREEKRKDNRTLFSFLYKVHTS